MLLWCDTLCLAFLQYMVVMGCKHKICLALILSCGLNSPDETADISGKECLNHGKAQSDKTPDFAFRYSWV